MAKVLTGQAVVGTPAYWVVAQPSRIVSCACVDMDGALDTFSYTQILAQKLRLIGVDVWLNNQQALTTHHYTFSVWRLVSKPESLLDMYHAENILPVLNKEGVWHWDWTGASGHFHWSMRKVYEGVTQRFGIVLTGAGAIIARMQASFQIEEG